MRFAALLAAIALVPIAFVGGYFAHRQPAVPGFSEYAVDQLGVRHVPGMDSDDWLAVPVTGPYKGTAVDVSDALAAFPNHAALERSAQGKVKYYEVRCQNYSSGGDKALMFTAHSVIRKCSASLKTRKQVLAYVKSQVQG